MEFKTVIEKLDAYCDISLAESWDNVGLLIEPYSTYTQNPLVKRVMLCIDLTVPALEEAKAQGATLIVAYHPVLFSNFKRITPSTGIKQRIACDALEHGIAVYCPHSSLDAKVGGMNEWLGGGIGAGEFKPITPAEVPPHAPGSGSGRVLTLAEPITVEEFGARLQKHLGEGRHVRLARSPCGAERIRTVSICVGSGAGVVDAVKVDAYLTGEMSHHVVLNAVESGVHVFLSEHTATERGFLDAVLKPELEKLFEGKIEFFISKNEDEIIRVV